MVSQTKTRVRDSKFGVSGDACCQMFSFKSGFSDIKLFLFREATGKKTKKGPDAHVLKI